jgi:hypothetical protein
LLFDQRVVGAPCWGGVPYSMQGPGARGGVKIAHPYKTRRLGVFGIHSGAQSSTRCDITLSGWVAPAKGDPARSNKRYPMQEGSAGCPNLKPRQVPLSAMPPLCLAISWPIP